MGSPWRSSPWMATDPRSRSSWDGSPAKPTDAAAPGVAPAAPVLSTESCLADHGGSPRAALRAATTCLAAAVALPALMAANAPPSPTIYNQLAALSLWGLAAACLAGAGLRHSAARSLGWCTTLRPLAPLWTALGIVLLATLAQAALGSLPWSLALSTAGMVLAAMIVSGAGAAARAMPAATQGFLLGCVVLGVLASLVALVQVFAPGWADGVLVARSTLSGRAVGNLRQPNHLATTLLWAAAAAVPWFAAAGTLKPSGESHRAARVLAVLGPAVFMLLIVAITLTASRTGLVGVVVLAAWGAIDRRLPGRWRVLLVLGPALYALAWLGMLAWAQQGTRSFGGAARLVEADVSGSRFAIWRDTWALVAAHPWLGVGVGEFNLAWSTTVSPQRPVAFFDHSHNLPLQLVVELGLPLGLGVTLLLGWALARAVRRAWASTDAPGALAARGMQVMVLTMAVHSMLEYPLWYAHLLLPTAFALGHGLAWNQGRALPPHTQAQASPTANGAPWRALLVSGALMTALGIAAMADYRRVTVIYEPGKSRRPLAERIEDGRRSWFYAHHADYAWATTAVSPGEAMPAFDRAKHYLLDARLMMAWSQAYAEHGDLERARYLADRLREFRNPATREWFDECKSPAFVEPPYQCTPASATFTWRDFR